MNLVRSRRMRTAAIVATLVFVGTGWRIGDRAEGAQAPACLDGNDETPSELARRRGAVAFVRAVNTAEARLYSAVKSYRPLSDLPNLPPMPDGFEAVLAAAVDVYAIAVKDTRDPCGYALFSDQNGLIYSGRPLQ